MSATGFDGEKLIKEIRVKLDLVSVALSQYNKATTFQGKFDYLNQAAKTLFGPAFILLPPAYFSVEMKGSMIGINNEQERIQTWVEEVAQVKQGATVFEEWQMVNTVLKDKADKKDKENK